MDELVKRLRHSANFAERGLTPPPSELRDAADAIEELLSWHNADVREIERQKSLIANDAYKRETKWIGVKERLPEVKEDGFSLPASSTVLFRTEWKTVHLGYVVEDSFSDQFGIYKVYRWYERGGYRIEDVSHWMPLPEPPKEEYK